VFLRRFVDIVFSADSHSIFQLDSCCRNFWQVLQTLLPLWQITVALAAQTLADNVVDMWQPARQL
jgi:hypothetical protein